MTSEMYSVGVLMSTLAIISSMRLMFSALSRRTRMPLLSMARMEFASLENGWMMGIISLGFTYCSCTMCVT